MTIHKGGLTSEGISNFLPSSKNRIESMSLSFQPELKVEGEQFSSLISLEWNQIENVF